MLLGGSEPNNNFPMRTSRRFRPPSLFEITRIKTRVCHNPRKSGFALFQELWQTLMRPFLMSSLQHFPVNIFPETFDFFPRTKPDVVGKNQMLRGKCSPENVARRHKKRSESESQRYTVLLLSVLLQTVVSQILTVLWQSVVKLRTKCFRKSSLYYDRVSLNYQVFSQKLS